MKRIIALTLALMVALALAACGGTSTSKTSSSSSSPSKTEEKKITSESAAIECAKNSGADYQIKSYFKSVGIDNAMSFQCDWGTCTAEQFGDSWRVTLKGNISGYRDDYNREYKTYSFEYWAYINAEGRLGEGHTTIIW